MTLESQTLRPGDHALDRYFFPFFVALIWADVLLGFVPEIIEKIGKHEALGSWVIHAHAAVFFGWLLLLTVQVAFVRSHRVRLHRRLGVWGAFHALAIVVFGVLVAVAVQRRDLGTARFDPAELSFQFAALVAFAGLAGAGLLARQTPAAHKRLMFLATLSISDPGFSRWGGEGALQLLGHGPMGEWGFQYLGSAILVAVLGAYDLLTRRRLGAALVLGAAFLFGLQLLATWLFLSPWWKPVAIDWITP